MDSEVILRTMERLKKARTPVRAGMTRTLSEIEAEILKMDPDKTILEFKTMKIKKLLEEVTELNEKIKDVMLDNEESAELYAEELKINEDYEDKASLVILKANKILHPSSLSGSELSNVSEFKRNFKLPKIELKKFSGDPLEWLGWLAQFSKIHEDETLHETDKFQYLCQAMVDGTRARKLVDTYPQTVGNYPKVIEALVDRFGDSVILSEVYVRQLLKMVLVNKNSDGNVQLSNLYDELESHIRALETLGVTASQSAIFLYPLVESSLPEEIVKVWQRSAVSGYGDAVPKSTDERLQALMKFLKSEVKGAERLSYVRAGLEDTMTRKVKMNKTREDVPTVANLHVGLKDVCIFCQKTNHSSAVCFKAKNMTMDERRDAVRESRSCFACLKKGHIVKSCRSPIRCSNCGRRHYEILCPGTLHDYRRSSDDVPGHTEGDKTTKLTTTNTSGASSGGQVLMKTVRVLVKGTNGIEAHARLLFDEGSQKSYIKTSLAETLMCPVLEEFLQQNNLFGGHVTRSKSRKLHKVMIKKLNGMEQQEMKLINEDVICSSCPTITPGPWITELEKENIFVADTFGDKTEDIQILIGSDLRESLMTGQRFKLQCGLVAVESIFGWTLSGQLPNKNRSYASMVISMLTSEKRSLPKLWDLETLGRKDTAEKIPEEEHSNQVKKDLQTKMIRDSEGRYFVRLLWINDAIEISSNQGVAEKRLLSATEKLKKQEDFKRYVQVFQDWGTFVGNRSREIGLFSHKKDWRYVPGSLNPADVPSRGCSPLPLLESKWWEGPVWLKDVPDDWPKTKEFLDSLGKFTNLVGRPNSDNSTNFVGAYNLLGKTEWKKVQKLFPVKKKQWSFDPPTAAWWGGWWERLIRSVKEYLGNLIQRKAEKSTPLPQVGDVVLVGSDNKKRYEWPLGRIVELIAGKDNKVRVAKVKTLHGILTRPMQRLFPLEVPTSQVFPKKPNPVSTKPCQDKDNSLVSLSDRRNSGRYCQWNN